MTLESTEDPAHQSLRKNLCEQGYFRCRIGVDAGPSQLKLGKGKNKKLNNSDPDQYREELVLTERNSEETFQSLAHAARLRRDQDAE